MKDLNVSLLLDFYGNLLSEKQLFIMEQYYQEDLSLSEISELAGMTRQGVHDNIKRAGGELKDYEKIRTLIKAGKTVDTDTYNAVCEQLDIIKNEA